MLSLSFQSLIYIIAFTSLLTCGLELTSINHPLAVHTQAQVQPDKKLPSAIAQTILNHAAQHSGVKSTELKIAQFTPKTFSNSCVFHFGEVCAQIYDPIDGWIVHVKVKEQLWTYHVNQSDSKIVLDPKISTLFHK